MRLVDFPAKFRIPFANAAGVGYRRTIPQASQIGVVDGAASLTDGFPPLNFSPVAAGGIPPNGADMNGVIWQTTSWVRALSAGAVVPYDAAFQSAIGGYPYRAQVMSSTITGLIYVSTADNNLTNPETGGAGWSVPFFIDTATEGLIVRGTANVAGIKLQAGSGPTPSKWIRSIGGNFSIVNNAYTAEIFNVSDAGSATLPGTLQAGAISSLGVVQGTYIHSTGNLQVDGSGQFNGNAYAVGQLQGGSLQIYGSGQVNGNFNANGQTSGTTVVATNGNVTAQNGRLRASLVSGGDIAAATLLVEFQYYGNAYGKIMQWPNGMMIQFGQFPFAGIGNMSLDTTASFGASGVVGATFPIAFPNACHGVIGGGGPDAETLEGSEMNVGVVTFDRYGATMRLSRTSGSNNSLTETGYCSFVAFGF